MVTDQEIAALREDIAQGRPWIPEGWRDEDRWVTRPVVGALGGLRECCRYDDAIPLAIAAMVEWGGSERRYWILLSKRIVSGDGVAELRDGMSGKNHDASAPTLYLAMRAACIAAIGERDGK